MMPSHQSLASAATGEFFNTIRPIRSCPILDRQSESSRSHWTFAEGLEVIGWKADNEHTEALVAEVRDAIDKAIADGDARAASWRGRHRTIICGGITDPKRIWHGRLPTVRDAWTSCVDSSRIAKGLTEHDVSDLIVTYSDALNDDNYTYENRYVRRP